MKTTCKICTIGGGTGQAAILHALSGLENCQVTGIVTVTDNGGSSATIRQSLHIPSPGDIRNCISHVASDSHLLTKLLQYRFSEGELTGVQLGNLIVGALSRLSGSYTQGLLDLQDALGLTTKILPASDVSTEICAELQSGQHICGERQIIKRLNRSPVLRYYLQDKSPTHRSVAEALHEADIIVICPGVLGTAIISALLHEGIKEAIIQSKAHLAYFCNIMTYQSQTDSFSVSDHVTLLEQYTGRRVDTLYVNVGNPSESLLQHYLTYGSEVVYYDKENLEDYSIVEDTFLVDIEAAHGIDDLHRAAGAGQHVGLHLIRHDISKVAHHISLLRDRLV